MEPGVPGTGRARRHAVTAADVARATGVSGATVSYVLNDTPGRAISEETRRRVRETAVRLGYLPSAAARTLAVGRSALVLVLVDSHALAAPSFALFVQELSRNLRLHGLAAIVHTGAEPSDIATVVTMTSPAVVVPFMRLDEEVLHAVHGVGAQIPPELDRVTRDVTADAGRLQVRYLASRGHRRLAYAASTEGYLRAAVGTRFDGVARACEELGLPPAVVAPVPPDPAGAEAVIRGWAALPNPPTAVCAYDDHVAHAVLAGMSRVAVGATSQLAVVGVDDAPFARTTTPPLTTIDVDGVQGGRSLAGALWALYNGEATSRSWIASDLHRVVVRESA